MRRLENGIGSGGGAQLAPPLLRAGARLSREEFLRIWEEHPEIKNAELIGGVVYMPSPVSRSHGAVEWLVGTLLGLYAADTPGLEGGHNSTTLLANDAPQPDLLLRVLPEYGGATRLVDDFVAGPPEFVAEVCASSEAYDLNEKQDLYEAGGVKEYLAVLLQERQTRFLRLGPRGYRTLPRPKDGVWKSKQFPGLWLDDAAILAGDIRAALRTLRKGLATPEHEAFAKELEKRKKKGSRR